MSNENIIHNLGSITTSRLYSLSRLYSYEQVNTSNVCKLHKAIKLILNTKDRVEVKVTVDVTHEEVIEIYQFLEDAIKAYKTKYNRTTVDKNMNVYQLIEALGKLNPAQIIREVLQTQPTSKVKKKLTKAEREEEAKEAIRIKMRVKMLG